MFKNKKIILIVLISLSLLGLFFYTSSKKIPPPDLSPIKAEEEIIDQATLQINDATYTSNISNITNVYDFMDKLRSEGKIDFTEKNYIGMGKLIEEINGIKNSGSQNWIYYVNEKKAEIGVSNYKIKKDDVVSWKYEESY